MYRVLYFATGLCGKTMKNEYFVDMDTAQAKELRLLLHKYDLEYSEVARVPMLGQRTTAFSRVIKSVKSFNPYLLKSTKPMSKAEHRSASIIAGETGRKSIMLTGKKSRYV